MLRPLGKIAFPLAAICGSGRFGIPCARAQSTTWCHAAAGLRGVARAELVSCEPPHADAAVAKATMVTAASARGLRSQVCSYDMDASVRVRVHARAGAHGRESALAAFAVRRVDRELAERVRVRPVWDPVCADAAGESKQLRVVRAQDRGRRRILRGDLRSGPAAGLLRRR